MVGNAIVNAVINSTSMVMGTTPVNSTVISAGLNAAMTVSGFAVGNSIVNTMINSVSISIGNTITNTFITTLNFIQGNSTMNTVIGQGVLTVGNLISVGNSLTNVVINSTAIAGVPVTSYQLNSTLAANVATMTANNAGYLGGTLAASYALLASPALSGTPTAPTAAPSTNTTQIATTAFVAAAVASSISYNSGYTSGLPTGANVISFVYNLGVIPSRVTILFKCLTAENDWSVGDVIINPMREYNGGYANWVTTSNTTVLRWILYSSTTVYLSLDKSTGGAVQATPSNWAYSFIIAP